MSQLAQNVMDYALLSQAIYDLGTDKFKSPNGWVAVGSPGLMCLLNPNKAAFEDKTNGFKASTFMKGNKLVVVFQGTTGAFPLSQDWQADIAAKMGFDTGQYKDALDYVGTIIQQAGNNYQVVLTGHWWRIGHIRSLNLGRPAIVFNAAPMGYKMISGIQNLNGNKSLVTNIDMKGDPVSALGGQIRVNHLHLGSSCCCPSQN